MCGVGQVRLDYIIVLFHQFLCVRYFHIIDLTVIPSVTGSTQLTFNLLITLSIARPAAVSNRFADVSEQAYRACAPRPQLHGFKRGNRFAEVSRRRYQGREKDSVSVCTGYGYVSTGNSCPSSVPSTCACGNPTTIVYRNYWSSCK